MNNENATRRNEMKQNDLEHLQNLLEQGKITAEQANVEKVKMSRVQLVTGKLPAQVRKALNNAVKRGELGHYKKDGYKPEAYFHPTFDYIARQDRNNHAVNTVKAVAGVVAM